MSYTPGPWELNYTRIDGAIVRWHLAGEKWGSVYPICEHVVEQEPSAAEQVNNALLLRAAPDMYEALEGLLSLGTTATKEQRIAANLRAVTAMNRARGMA